MEQWERIQYIWNGPEQVIRPGHELKLRFDAQRTQEDLQLYYRGEPAISYLWMDEPDMLRQYMKIDDALDSVHADREAFCLDLSSDAPKPWAKRAVKKVSWPPRLSYLPLKGHTDRWTAGIRVRGAGVTVEENGFLRVLIDRWDRRPGMAPEFTGRLPDQRVVLDLPRGTYDWQQAQVQLDIPSDTTACVLYTLEGRGYRGEVYVEAPELVASNGYNILPSFGPSVLKEDFFEWFGENLSRKEWPCFWIRLNGCVIWDGELFARCHRYPGFAVNIPHGLVGERDNELSIRLTTTGHDPVPFRMKEAALISRKAGAVRVVGWPEFVPLGKTLPVLLDVRQKNAEVLAGGKPLAMPEDCGLHVVQVEVPDRPGKFCTQLQVDGREFAVEAWALPETEDRVITGTGDMIYINADDPAQASDYLRWYTANRVGGLLTLRPAYRWGGSRAVNQESWQSIRRVAEGLGLRYSHMVEGRDVPGVSVNPTAEELAGENFLGRQLHERDGQLFYWKWPVAHIPSPEFGELGIRKFLEEPERTQPASDPVSLTVVDGQYCLRRDVGLPADMEQLARSVEEELRTLRRNYTRHTGPSAQFHAFYRAGFTWLGAETMYGSLESTVSILRGASKAWKAPCWGVHHALQWSTSPHDAPEHVRRYRLALYLSYMHGAGEINTEEGLWYLEEYYSHFDRFSDTCRAHLVQQQELQRYIGLHRRTGQFYTPAAFLQGRYDGWQGFGKLSKRVWGQPDIPVGDPEGGWQLMQAAYPLNKPGQSLYCHDCPTSEPMGFFSGTPYGCADVTPAELGDFAGYRLLVFTGYHKAQAEDAQCLGRFMQQGGTLVAGWAHLSQTTLRCDVEAGRHSYIDFPGVPSRPEFIPDTVNGRTIHVAQQLPEGARVLHCTDSGKALVYAANVGEGQLVFLNTREYVGDPTLLPICTQIVTDLLARAAAEESVWMQCGDDVEFTVYDQPDGSRVFYVLAVDWYRRPETLRTAQLRVDGQPYTIQLPFSRMVKIVVQDGTAVWADRESVEIRGIDKDGVHLLGTEPASVFVARDGRVQQFEVEFSQLTYTLNHLR